MQTDLFKIHEFENTKDNQANLDQNKVKFSGQAKYVLELLRKGYKLTRKSAMVDFGVMSLERRIKDLRDYHKIDIKAEWVLKEDGKRSHKIYYL